MGHPYNEILPSNKKEQNVGTRNIDEHWRNFVVRYPDEKEYLLDDSTCKKFKKREIETNENNGYHWQIFLKSDTKI